MGVVSKGLPVELGRQRIVKTRGQMAEMLGERTTVRKTADTGALRLEGTWI